MSDMYETAEFGESDAEVRVAAEAKKSFFSRFFKREKKVGLPASLGQDKKRRVSLMDPHSTATEQFRTLRARIDAIATQHPVKTIAVTSAAMGDGKSISATNLAIVSAMSVGQRVLLIDCDFRRPAIASALGVDTEAGLAEVLTGDAKLTDAIVHLADSNLDVLCVHEKPLNPSELLASQAMQALIAEVSTSYDRVILDTPIALGLPDVKSVSACCDGVVLVVRAGKTDLEAIEECLDLLDRRRVLGLVLNGAEQDSTGYEYK